MSDVVVGKIHDFNNGDMKKITVDDVSILLTKIDGKFYATGAVCTHYGAPLDEGVLSGDRIVCPWHHACFHAKTGDLQEPPAQDALPSYEVYLDGDEIHIQLPEKIEESRTPHMAKPDPKADSRTFVILGGGAAGNAAAQTLREDGYQGRIVMISREKRLPYDRPNLSKEYLMGTAEPEWMPLRGEDFYKKHGIETMLGPRVLEVDVNEKLITFEDGERLEYDSILLATGGRPRTLNVPGADLKNIFTLRSQDDADLIIKAIKTARKVVIIGSSFIGLEAAYSLGERNLDITVVGMERVPFERVFGEKIGTMFRTAHEKHGTHFELEHSVSQFEGEEKVKAVILDDGQRLEADLVLVAIGVQPITDYLQGLDLLEDDSIKVDGFFHAGKDVYAAGDIATFPDWHTGLGVRIEHWRIAEQHGRYAAHNMAGKKVGFRSVPFFWTMQVGLSLRYVGHAKEWDEIMVNGDVTKQDFIAFFIKNNQVHAAAGIGHDREMDAIEELMRLKNMLPPAALRKQPLDLLSHLNK